MVKEILDLFNERPIEEQEEKQPINVPKKILGATVTAVIDTVAIIGTVCVVGLFSALLLRPNR